MAEWVAIAFSVISSLMLIAVAHGMFKAKIADLDKRVDDLYAFRSALTEKYVSISHFEFVIGAIQENQREISKDIRSILKIISKYGEQ